MTVRLEEMELIPDANALKETSSAGYYEQRYLPTAYKSQPYKIVENPLVKWAECNLRPSIEKMSVSPQMRVRGGKTTSIIVAKINVNSTGERSGEVQISGDNYDIANLLVTSQEAFATILMLADVSKATLGELLNEVLSTEEADDVLGNLNKYGIIEFNDGHFHLTTRGKETVEKLRTSIR